MATVETIEKNTVKLTCEVDAATFEAGMVKSYKKNVKSINIPGFRKGKAPRTVIEHMYGPEIFYDDAVNEVCPQAYEDAVKETGIEPVDRPEIDIVSVGKGQPLVFTAKVTVKPEVTLGTYKGIEVETVAYAVEEADVEREIKAAQERVARWETVEDRPVAEGDRVTLDYAGTVDGEAFAGGTAEGQTLEIGSHQFIPGFEEQMVGMSIGEEKDLSVKFPDEYHAEELKGKDAVFHVKVHDIKVKEVPELDDEFAKDVSEFDTLADYKADIRAKLEERARTNAQNQMDNTMIESIMDTCEVDIPDCMVERQLDNMMRDLEWRMMYQGLNLQDYLKYTGNTIEGMRAEQREEALRRVKGSLVLEAIQKAEDIQVAPEDFDKAVAEMAKSMGKSAEEYKETMRPEEIDYINEEALGRKTIEFLRSQAVMVEPKPAPEQKADADEKAE
ncbi:MAG: trigger factor [Christensenellales bacterium]